MPGVAGLYRWLYRLAIAGAARVLRGSPGCAALYLSRGCSKGEIVPGLSDIDLIVIAGPGSTAGLERRLRMLRRLSAGLIPYDPAFLLTAEELRYRWDQTALWRYRYQEGKSNWRLLCGTDALSALPEITPMQRKAACVAEMGYWWVQFARFVIADGSETILRNSICYKVVAETLNARHALRTGEFCYAKAEALRREDSALAQSLARKAQDRYLGRDEALEEEAYRFLAGVFGEVWERFGRDPWLDVIPGMRQRVEATAETGGQFANRPVRVVRSAFFGLEDRLMILDSGNGPLPPLRTLREWLRQAGGDVCRPLFLKAGSVVFPLTPRLARDFHRGVLMPATAPDVFLQLESRPVFWTAHTAWYLTGWKRNRLWADATPLKIRQLEVIEHGAAGGEIVYRLTEEAIARCLEAECLR